jgi:hypothetical protein
MNWMGPDSRIKSAQSKIFIRVCPSELVVENTFSRVAAVVVGEKSLGSGGGFCLIGHAE